MDEWQKRANMTSKMYRLDSFHDFTKVVFVLNICLVILSETALLVAEHHLVCVSSLIYLHFLGS